MFVRDIEMLMVFIYRIFMVRLLFLCLVSIGEGDCLVNVSRFCKQVFGRSFLDSLGLPKAVHRVCHVDGLPCVDPCSRFCGSYPFPVDPVDPHGEGSFCERGRVIVPACARCIEC